MKTPAISKKEAEATAKGKAKKAAPCPLLNTAEAAIYLECSAHTLVQWRYKKKGPEYVKQGQYAFYTYAALDEWIREKFGEAELRRRQKLRRIKTIRTHTANKFCPYYPCHNLQGQPFDCSMCYCPLYHLDDCGGDPRYTASGLKSCKACKMPHTKAGKAKILKRLYELYN